MRLLKQTCSHLALLAAATLPLLAQTAPPVESYIVRYSISDPAPGSTYESGPLYIVYSDGKAVIIRPPKKLRTPNDWPENQEGFSDAQLADDRQTLGWSELYDNPGTSYAVPLTLVLFRSGRILFRIQQGQMLWDWTFLEGGNQVATVWGFTHGPEVGDYQLYDVNTKQMISEVHGVENTQSLPSHAPAWAKQLEEKLNGRPVQTPPTPQPRNP